MGGGGCHSEARQLGSRAMGRPESRNHGLSTQRLQLCFKGVFAPVDPVPCPLSPCACPHISSVSTHSQQVSTPPVWPVLPWRLPSSLCGQVSLILPIRCLGRPSRIQSLHFSLFFVVSRHVCFLVGLNVKLMVCDHYGSWRTVFNIPLSTVLLVPTSLCRLPALSVPAPAPMPSSRNGDVYLFETRSFLAA